MTQAADSAASFAAGKDARRSLPRSDHGEWAPGRTREDPVSVLQADDVERLPQLLPIRYGRMQASPLAFYRGAASIMAHDLAPTPVSGFRTQLCGDAHLMNFGAFGSPERSLVFDVNDFDETLQGPWEWDVKRLAASVVVAGRHLNLGGRCIDRAVRACVRSYREHMIEYARMHVLDVWYARLDANEMLELVRSAEDRRAPGASPSPLDAHVGNTLVTSHATPHAIADQPPLVFHPEDRAAFLTDVRALFARYHDTLGAACRSLLDRFELVDAAYKVVGVGSVGTRCYSLLLAAGDDTLLLQAKEARRSALQPFADAAPLTCEGERVVEGQRAMQAVSDIFLGWSSDDDGHDFYFRQAHDMKTSANVDRMTSQALRAYVSFCGWALARAHAKAGGNAALIAGYLGRGEQFDDALGAFAQTYADQNERDFTALLAAIAAGRVRAEPPAKNAASA